jgi:2-keto-4-pentenoate hydratase/2-oxohepta-3-ene-1,7-dioic acid hydratase in catechol pathway
MKICRFSFEDETHIGVIDDDRVHVFGDMLSDHVASFDLAEVMLLPPVSPSKIVCVGRNYADHAKELGNDVPAEPLLFLKAPSAIIYDGSPIVIPPQSDQVEHEGELAIVISKKCKGLTDNDDPMDHVFGFTCLNDVTARDLQRKDGQFTRAKSFDTFCPIGPFIETELDTTDISVTTRVNGEVRQHGRTSQMVFPVDFLIRYISNMMTLNAGDVIATGTPSGVSKMNPGDVCEVDIEGIGTLRNPVV